ncbi:hypothetical protein [Microbacterium sp. JZ31]|uniref:hypothetical protein n=1 Tax=Microbacterium sp. JZ31 TaxID=1906274 RepID=UPI001931F59B|nr:hypothetical protein [Microbacterium sp. JZ31]
MSGYYEDPETQGTDPVAAELGPDGQGDLAPEDLPQQQGVDEGGSVRLEDDVLDSDLEDVGTTSPDAGAGLAPGAGDVIYGGSNVDTMPRSADDFREVDPDLLGSPGATGESSLDTDATPSGTGDTGSGIETIAPSADARAERGAGTVEQQEPVHATSSTAGVSPIDAAGGATSAAGGASVPPGREGADSGAVESVGVEGASSPDVERSSQNDIAGVGPASGRDAGDVSTGGEAPVDPSENEPSAGNSAAEPGADANNVEDAPTAHDSADRDIPGVPDAVGPGGAGEQTSPRQDLNSTNVAQQVQGIVVQMQGDLGTERLAEAEVQDVLERRLTDAGISADVEQIEQLSRQIVSGSTPTDVDEGQPGATS